MIPNDLHRANGAPVAPTTSCEASFAAGASTSAGAADPAACSADMMAEHTTWMSAWIDLGGEG